MKKNGSNCLVASIRRISATARSLIRHPPARSGQEARSTQSFIVKHERRERRIDVVEFVAIAQALGVDPVKLFWEFLSARGWSPTQLRR
ncbi:hypothetical protein ACVIIW_006842 [Bradyrhizobium sp. USDA 4449]